MRVVDRRIRTVARAIRPTDGHYIFHGRHVRGYDHISMRDLWVERAHHRRDTIRAAVRVLAALDGDAIDQWTETIPSCGGEIRGWITPPHSTDMRVHVTVSHVGPAPGPIDGLTDDEADRFADAIREGR